NERGGIDVGGTKMKVELIEYDDKTSNEEAIKNYQRLMTVDKVDFVIPPYGTGINLAVAPLIAKNGYPHIAVTAVADAAEAVRDADIVVTTTPATSPILKAEWLTPGQHVTAMGSDAEHKNEIDPAIFAKAVYVADSLSQTRRLGELHHAVAAGLIPEAQVFPEIGQVIAGIAVGRAAPDDLTLCDLTGTGVQDTAIATLAVARARAAKAGTPFES
ncbi:MAG: ABC transporter substrate-binding protein, partial [Bauldia litoralis]